MRTDFDTLQLLASYCLNHLQEARIIEYQIDQRTVLIDSLATELNVSFSTEEDIKEQAIEEVQDKFGTEIPGDITETEMYNHAKKEIIKSFSGESISGLYLTESLHHVALRIKDYLLNKEEVEEVYATDSELVDFMVERLRKFSIKRL